MYSGLAFLDCWPLGGADTDLPTLTNAMVQESPGVSQGNRSSVSPNLKLFPYPTRILGGGVLTAGVNVQKVTCDFL